MYLNFYNLSSKPFDIGLDLKFLWLGEKHKEALAAMKYGILENKGFISLTGDEGAGKSTIVSKLANILGDNVIFAKIADPPLKKLDFFNFTAAAFEMNKKFSTKVDFLAHFKRFLNQAHNNNKEVVLIIEEAHRLHLELLEEIRLFSNIERPNKKLINILFVGQNEFINILEENRALKQLINIGYHIEPLSDIETEQYIIHRLKVAGSEKKIFSPGAIREIFAYSTGNLRLINVICDLALMRGYEKKSKIIKSKIIKECAENVAPIPQAGKDASEDRKALIKTIQKNKIAIQPTSLERLYQNFINKVRNIPVKRKVAYLTPFSLIILTCTFGYLYYLFGYKAYSRSPKTAALQPLHRLVSSKSKTSSQNPNEITISPDGIDKPQNLELTAEKAPPDNQLLQLQSRNAELEAELKELNSSKERITELESVLTMRERMLSESEKKLTALEKELDQEKESKEALKAVLSSKLAVITEFQETLEASQSNATELESDIEKSNKKIAELQALVSDLQAQKASADNRLSQLQTRTAELNADLKELNSAKERVTELESAVTMREQMLAESGQKLTALEKELAQEKESKEVLKTELSAKLAEIAEFQETLEASQSNAIKLQSEIEIGKKKIAELEELVSNLKAQKASADDQLGQLQARTAELNADLKELKSAKERITELKSVLTTSEQMLAESEQKVAELEKDLEQEKKNTDTLNAELSSKDAVIAEFQEKLQASQSNAIKLEDEIEISQKKIAELQSRLSDSKQQIVPATSSPEIVETQKRPASTSETFESEAESPDPADIIDYVLKKKSD